MTEGQELDKILAERAQTHGEFTDVAYLSQELKRVLHDSLRDEPPIIREGLEQVCHKIARIVAGDKLEPEHWLDAEGYLRLVRERLENLR